jgi:hypothetical protein
MSSMMTEHVARRLLNLPSCRRQPRLCPADRRHSHVPSANDHLQADRKFPHPFLLLPLRCRFGGFESGIMIGKSLRPNGKPISVSPTGSPMNWQALSLRRKTAARSVSCRLRIKAYPVVLRPEQAHEGHISSVYTEPTYRGTGVARKRRWPSITWRYAHARRSCFTLPKPENLDMNAWASSSRVRCD